MLVWEVAGKYAHALFLSAKEKGLLSSIYEQMNDLEQVITKDPSLLTFLGAPQVLQSAKKDLIRRVFLERVERLLVEFLIVLVDKGRVRYLKEIIDEFARMVEAEHGVGRVTVVSAVGLTDDERARLTKKMAAKTGLKIVLEEKVDPSIVGGLIVILHNEIIDGSISHGLNKVWEQLDKVRVH